ncbi:hypothetical protein ACWDTQ_22840 [Streptomyces cellulosae]|uniref:IclR-ED domain-containing protein n=1 Tax=Streptomyces cellulosae TaxID=1968 RepID=A0ABW6JIL7_STRCE
MQVQVRTATERILDALAEGRRVAPALWDIAEDITHRGVPASCIDITDNPVYWGVGLVESSMGAPEVREAVRRAPRSVKRVFWSVRREMQQMLKAA